MAVIPAAGLAGTPFRPVVAQAGFLPLETPLFDSREAYGAAARERRTGVQDEGEGQRWRI